MNEETRAPRAAPEAEAAHEVKDAPAGLSEAEFSSFMESLNTMAPLLGGLGSVLGGKRSEACAVREAFLLSLKPYLSPTRCEAVDYLVRIARIGDILRTLS
ncbi:MAG: hypothetical protein IKA46_00555 [Clostridia bacterium]|nr:hypothetical protein [Clostridia bacterium]